MTHLLLFPNHIHVYMYLRHRYWWWGQISHSLASRTGTSSHYQYMDHLTLHQGHGYRWWLEDVQWLYSIGKITHYACTGWQNIEADIHHRVFGLHNTSVGYEWVCQMRSHPSSFILRSESYAYWSGHTTSSCLAKLYATYMYVYCIDIVYDMHNWFSETIHIYGTDRGLILSLKGVPDPESIFTRPLKLDSWLLTKVRSSSTTTLTRTYIHKYAYGSSRESTMQAPWTYSNMIITTKVVDNGCNSNCLFEDDTIW